MAIVSSSIGRLVLLAIIEERLVEPQKICVAVQSLTAPTILGDPFCNQLKQVVTQMVEKQVFGDFY